MTILPNILIRHWHGKDCEPFQFLLQTHVVVVADKKMQLIWGYFNENISLTLLCCPFCRTQLSCAECEVQLKEKDKNSPYEDGERLCSDCEKKNAVGNGDIDHPEQEDLDNTRDDDFNGEEF
jgi:uncharacterized protein YbaR (Trm112 family)